MKQLIIAEKPSVARDLGKVLGTNKATKTYLEGPNVIITWALGHLLTLKMPEDYHPEWKTWSMETLPMIPKKAGIKPLPKTRGQLQSISKLLKRSDIKEVVIATDAGREGELVARWILEYARYQGPVKRLWISSQTDKAIKDGFRKLRPSQEFDALYESALARSQADWLVGLNVSRALTVKYEDSLSAGRVQTPTLAMVRKQERKIETFRPVNYFELKVVSGGLSSRLSLKDNVLSFRSQEEAEKVENAVRNESLTITNVEEKLRKEWSPLPYDLTELQQVANQRFGYSAKKTLNILQGLYERHKIVSYPRTDSKHLTQDIEATMKDRLQAVTHYLPAKGKEALKQGATVKNRAVFQDRKVTDHHGLIPTEQLARAEKLDNDEQRIYLLIVERFLGLFFPPSVKKTQRYSYQLGTYSGKFEESFYEELGWRRDEKEGHLTASWKKGATIPFDITTEAKVTTPPSPLTESMLLSHMEKHNLGTPATRAEIIERLIQSELMLRERSRLQVTPKGKQLLELVNPSLVTPELTSHWEQALEKIAAGTLKRTEFIRDIEKETTQLVKEIKQSEKKYTDFALTTKKCPECQEPLREKRTRNGMIYVCSNVECDYSRRKDPKVSNKRCPQCHKKMEILEGKNGSFFKCKHCAITEKMTGKKERRKKMTKHEERKLMKKYNQEAETEESPLAIALRQAMEKEK